MSVCAARAMLAPHGRKIALRYAGIVTGMNLIWEIAQLPLYTIWRTGSTKDIAFAVAHCTAGDLLIAVSSFALALLVAADATWPHGSRVRVIAATVLFGATYTVFSEWMNVNLRGSWAYEPAMPLVPPFGTGLTPLLQWILIPPVALALAARMGRPQDQRILNAPSFIGTDQQGNGD